MKQTEPQGAIKALIDEYERAAVELKAVFNGVSEEEFTKVTDTVTQNEHCRSIQTIVAHVICAGYGYAHAIRDHFKKDTFEHTLTFPELNEATRQIDDMLKYTIQTFDSHRELCDEKISTMKLRTRWGTDWSMEQLLEHAIVHVLRHRRQVEQFLSRLRSPRKTIKEH